MTTTTITLSRAEYEDLVDARDHAMTMRDIAAGAATLTAKETAAYLAARSPLEFWRKQRGITQKGLGALTHMNASSISLAETGKRGMSIRGWLKVAKALSLHIEDLIPPERR